MEIWGLAISLVPSIVGMSNGCSSCGLRLAPLKLCSAVMILAVVRYSFVAWF